MSETDQPIEETQTEGPIVIRNHISVIFGNIITLMIVLAFIVFVNRGTIVSAKDELGMHWWYLLPIIALFLFMIFIFWRRWKLTTYTFTDSELRVFRNTIFKSEAHIQYSRLASVNVRRTIINHIFGTTQLLFNVNSSVNSNRAEAVLTLESSEADRLRETISSKIFKREMVIKEEETKESLVEISNFDVILHGMFGQTTTQTIIGLLALAYSIGTFYFGNSAGSITALIVFALSTALPWIRTILRYYNYRIYRVDDTITVESGLISNYRSSFNLKKVNSVRIREPLLARLMGRAILEAEVVGLADSNGLPLLCPLKNKAIVEQLSKELVPEFLFDFEKQGQPVQAKVPTLAFKIICSAISVFIGSIIFIFGRIAGYENNIDKFLILLIAVSFAIIIPIILLIHGLLAQRHREFAIGDETFMFAIGAYDRETNFIRFDKVQKTRVTGGPIQRRFGVATCTVSLMSSSGVTNIESGIFDRETLERIPNEIMARIKDGRYDYRRYQ